MEIIDLTGKLATHPRKFYARRPLDLIRYIAIHHAASSEDATPEQIARFHVYARGWPGIAYHYLVAPDGRIYKCWPATMRTYCVRGHNTHCLCVCLLGNREAQPAPEVQMRAAVELVRQLADAYRVPPERILGHREFPDAATACPGRHIDMSSFREHVIAFGRHEGGGE